MVLADEITLISEVPRGVFESTTETETRVLCTVKSVGMSEFYKAKSEGIEPEICFVLRNFADYDGQKRVEHNGKRYAVVRTYVSKEALEIYCERVNPNDDTASST